MFYLILTPDEITLRHIAILVAGAVVTLLHMRWTSEMNHKSFLKKMMKDAEGR